MAGTYAIVQRKKAPPEIKPFYNDLSEAATALDYVRRQNPGADVVLVRVEDQQQLDIVAVDTAGVPLPAVDAKRL